MYYTTSGAYRKSKMIIDYLNIVLSVAIGIIFIMILFLRSKSGMLFPVIFILGAVVNGTTAAKKFMDSKKAAGAVMAAATIALGLMAAFTWGII